jgi:translation initiation factor IF-2
VCVSSAKHPAAAFIELEPDSKDAELYSVDRAGDVKFQLSEKEKVKRFVALILARRQAKLQKDKQAMLDQANRFRKPEN